MHSKPVFDTFSECSSSRSSSPPRPPSPLRKPASLPRSHTHPSDLSAAARPTCNEQVLRSRLQGVLRDVSCPPPRRRAMTSGEAPLLTTSPTPSRSPVTPPATPFDAGRIAQELRCHQGYVSFADVQGLGIPSDELACHPDPSPPRWWSLWKG
ncbi:hypothetical protein CTheo_579 [Ceratobasidium theobromae]|uniref:Uncharacterized protein n=1 Tax=Ceratobasidium theobromae TaxID=1582974 RepID=A0A5N5QWD4_9AGAM|nr:hypothetical protein CTheo_579 [Ceratobasidium theobromae]